MGYHTLKLSPFIHSLYSLFFLGQSYFSIDIALQDFRVFLLRNFYDGQVDALLVSQFLQAVKNSQIGLFLKDSKLNKI